MPTDGIKVIHHNAGGIDRPDDPTLPFRLELSLRAPSFMNVAFVYLYGGTEEIRVRGVTVDALRAFCAENGLDTHVRLLRGKITAPESPEPTTVLAAYGREAAAPEAR